MNFNFKDKRNILKILSIFLSLMFVCTVLYSVTNHAAKQETKSKYLLANEDSADIDINSIELKASLGRLTNTQRLQDLKKEMTIKKTNPAEEVPATEDALTKEAIKRGIVVQQGLIIDIGSLKTLKEKQPGFTNAQLIEEAKKKKIIKQLGLVTLADIDIDKLIALKNNMSGKTDYEITRRAIQQGIIKGEFDDKSLAIDANLDLTQLDVTQFGYNKNDYVKLSDLKNNQSLNGKTLDQLNIKGGKIKTEYNIDLKKNPIKDADIDEVPKDIAILVDTAVDNNSYLANALNNYIFTNSSFINNMPSDTNFIVIPYHIDKARQDSLYYYNQCNHNNYKDDLQQMITKLKDDGGKSVDKTDTIDRPLRNAETWFNKKDSDRATAGKTVQSTKAILFLTGGIDEKEYNKCFKTNQTDGIRKFILEHKYNATSIFFSDYGYRDTAEHMSEPYATKMHELHNEVGGIDSSFYVTYTEKPTQTTHNDINSIEQAIDKKCIAQKVSEDLLNSQSNRFVSTNGILHFNIGEDLKISESRSDQALTDEGNNKWKIAIPNISLKTDYSIMGDANLDVTKEYIDDLINNIINNTGIVDGSGKYGILNSEVKLFLQNRLKDIDIRIEDKDVEEIIKNMYEEKLNITIEQLNQKYNYMLFKATGNDYNNATGKISGEQYDNVKGKKVINILKNENNAYPVAKYGMLRSLLMDTLREDMFSNLNNTLGKKVSQKYDTNISAKNDLINKILAGKYDEAKSIIITITSCSDSVADKILTKIKNKFDASTLVSVLIQKEQGTFDSSTVISKLKLSDTSVETINNKKISSNTLKSILDMDSSNDDKLRAVQDEIRDILSQMINKPLKLTKTTFNVSSENSTIEFNIEPTVKATFDESKDQLTFVPNSSSEKNNYLQYNSTVNNTSADTKEEDVNSLPILNMRRVLVDKSHYVYGSIGEFTTKDYRNIKAAVEIDHGSSNNLLVFADKSVVTFASNITCLSGIKNIRLTIDSKFKDSNGGTMANTIVQAPKIYKVNYHDINNDKDDTLQLISAMKKVDNGSGLVYVAEGINGDDNKDIIVLYSAKLNGKSNAGGSASGSFNPDSTYKNIIEVTGLSGGEESVYVKLDDEFPLKGNLPDLY